MALYRSDAFVLHTYKLGENDQIVVLFTRDFGKLRAVARRSHSPRRHAASACQPLMLLHVIVFGRPTQNLYRVQSVDILQALRPLHEDFERLRCGLYVTELIDAATHDREPAPELFALMHDTLEQLTQTVAPARLLRLFESRVLLLTGYAPQLECCAHCDRPLQAHECTFSPRLGGLLCTACAPLGRYTVSVSPATVAVLRRLMHSETAAVLTCPLADATELELERLLQTHLTTCLGRALKSYAFLHL
ncbi:MAG: DNA repair protein RecO [Candidatus Tectimicrobiota bacterium]